MPVPQSLPCPRFQPPPHRTQHADFPHYALLHTLSEEHGSFRKLRAMVRANLAKHFRDEKPSRSNPSKPYAVTVGVAVTLHIVDLNFAL